MPLASALLFPKGVKELAEFYSWRIESLNLITLLLALCVFAQTLVSVLSWYRHPRSHARICENLLEFFVLCQLLVLSLLHGQVVNGWEISLIAPVQYAVLRWAGFAVCTFFTCVVMARIKKPWPLLVIAACLLTLPIVEALSGNVFPWLYLAALGFWLMRAIHICLLRYRELGTSISASSIKNAVDSLLSGVLFYETDGFVLLSNVRMQQLMLKLTGKVRRNGNHFYDLLLSGELLAGCQTTEYEGQVVCLLPDGTAWMFTRTELSIRNKKYIQLVAADVTQRWALTAQLQQQEDLLRQRGEELRETIADVHILSRERETQKAKIRAHDILGQRLSLLLRTVRSRQALDYDLLHGLAQGLLDDLNASQGTPIPQDEFESLRQAFQSIGVEIRLDGDLPQNAVKGRLFVDIIRESVTNAVRHGFATEITVRLDNTDGGHHLEVANNGHPPAGPIIEGGGISGMRSKVKPHGGVLDVTAHPRFKLVVDLPVEGEND